MILDFFTAQEIVFKDPKIRRALPEFESLFAIWLHSVSDHSTRQTGRKAVLEFLAGLSDRHLAVISGFVGEEVRPVVLNYGVKNVETRPDCLEAALNGSDSYANFFVSKGADKVSVCFWK